MIHILEKNNQNLAHIDLYSKLMTDRIIFISQVIDSDLVTEVQAQLLYLASINSDPIKIYINSPGGSCYDGFGLYDTMQLIKKTCIIETCNIGLCASMASFLLAGGTKGHRYSLPNSTVMIHQPSAGTFGKVTDMQVDVKEFERVKSKLIQIFNENCGQDHSEVMERDFWIDAEKAVEMGIIDKIK